LGKYYPEGGGAKKDGGGGGGRGEWWGEGGDERERGEGRRVRGVGGSKGVLVKSEQELQSSIYSNG